MKEKIKFENVEAADKSEDALIAEVEELLKSTGDDSK
jgi:hypothetical protein